MFRFARTILCASRTTDNVLRDFLPALTVTNTATVNLIQAASFKSHLSVDSVYPNSNPDYLRHNEKKPQTNPEEFTGYIPVEELDITTSRSSGPGGQSVNTVNSKVDVRFHLDSASWIPDWVKSRLAQQEQGRINKDGYFIVRSDATRKQLLNQADCMDKLRTIIFKAATLPAEISKEDLKIKEKRIAKAKAGVLREKRQRSLIKKSRQGEGL